MIFIAEVLVGVLLTLSFPSRFSMFVAIVISVNVVLSDIDFPFTISNPVMAFNSVLIVSTYWLLRY